MNDSPVISGLIDALCKHCKSTRVTVAGVAKWDNNVFLIDVECTGLPLDGDMIPDAVITDCENTGFEYRGCGFTITKESVSPQKVSIYFQRKICCDSSS